METCFNVEAKRILSHTFFPSLSHTLCLSLTSDWIDYQQISTWNVKGNICAESSILLLIITVYNFICSTFYKNYFTMNLALCEANTTNFMYFTFFCLRYLLLFFICSIFNGEIWFECCFVHSPRIFTFFWIKCRKFEFTVYSK